MPYKYHNNKDKFSEESQEYENIESIALIDLISGTSLPMYYLSKKVKRIQGATKD